MDECKTAGNEVKPRFNKMQVAVLTHYARGEFSYLLTSEEDQDDATLETCGDGLLRFIIQEISEDEGCDDSVTAEDRLETAIEQMRALQLILPLDEEEP
jgi:hypothetical protein